MKKLFALTFALSLLALSLPKGSALVSAQSPTSTTIRDTVKQQVESELNQIKSATSKKAYVGTVTAKADGILTITNLQNQSRSATLTTDAAIKLTGGKDGTPADVKTGDFIIAMGDADGQGMLTVKRLIVTSKPAVDKRAVYFGTIAKASASSLTLTSTDGKDVTLKLLGSTKYTGTTKAADVKAGSKVATIASSTSTALFIHLFPL